MMAGSKSRKASRGPSAGKSSAQVQDLLPVRLPVPRLDGRISVRGALERRRTVREIRPDRLPLRMLSNLLWAACGVNRRTGPFGIPGRTAASASNSQEIDLYILLEEGAYQYDPFQHMLLPVVRKDLRAKAIGRGQTDSITGAPFHIIYVVDVDRLIHTSGYQEPGLRDPEIQKSYYYVDTGLIAANVYLFAASAGLASWFHNCDRPGLMAALPLRPSQRVLFGQTVGYPPRTYTR
jgi:hypothetical protein